MPASLPGHEAHGLLPLGKPRSPACHGMSATTFFRDETFWKFLGSHQDTGRPEPWSSGSAHKAPQEQWPCCNCEKGFLQGHTGHLQPGCPRPSYFCRAAMRNVALLQATGEGRSTDSSVFPNFSELAAFRETKIPKQEPVSETSLGWCVSVQAVDVWGSLFINR